MKAILLAAGRGSRMKEKTDFLPKCLTELWGKTLLEWELKAIREGGIHDIAIVDGYRSENIERYLEDNKLSEGVTFFHNENWETTNMVSTLLEADEWLKNDACIVSYTDIVYSSNAIRELNKSSQNITISYYTKFKELWESRFSNPLDDVESFKLDQNSFLVEIGRKVSSLSVVEGQYMGLLKFTPKGWQITRDSTAVQDLPKPLAKMDMTSLLDYLIQRGIKIKAIPYDELWLEIDNQDDLHLYESLPSIKYKCLF